MSEVIFHSSTIAQAVGKLGLRCRWCGHPIEADDLRWYSPHNGGVPIAETFPQLAWVYFHCRECGYDWALWKLLGVESRGREIEFLKNRGALGV